MPPERPERPVPTRLRPLRLTGFGHAPHTCHHGHAIPPRLSPDAHSFGSLALPGAARAPPGCVVSCSDTRCRAARQTAHPRLPPEHPSSSVRCTSTAHLPHIFPNASVYNDISHRPLDRKERPPHAGRRGRSTGVARGRAYRRLRTHRRHADRRTGLPGRHSGLAVPAPLRLPRRLRGPARHGGTRLLAPRAAHAPRPNRRRRPAGPTAASHSSSNPSGTHRAERSE